MVKDTPLLLFSLSISIENYLCAQERQNMSHQAENLAYRGRSPSSYKMPELPEELIEMITEYLTLADISSLRLCNRSACFKASNGIFKTHFGPAKRLLLDSRDNLHLAAANSALSNQATSNPLERLTIAGVAFIGCQKDGLKLDHDQVHLLCGTLEHLKNSSQSRLRSLTLAVVSDIDGDLQRPKVQAGGMAMAPIGGMSRKRQPPRPSKADVWYTVAKTFQVVMKALETSRLRLEELRLFGEVEKLGIACDQIPDLPHAMGFEDVQQLSVCFSHHLISEVDKNEDEEDEEEEKSAETDLERKRIELPIGVQNSARMFHFLRQFRAIEDLDLKWTYYGPVVRRTIVQEVEEHFFNSLALNFQWSSLRSLTLDGIRTKEDRLCHFLRRHRHLKKLIIKEIFLSEGHWQPVFDLLAGTELDIEYLYLNWLYADRKTLHFSDAMNPYYRYAATLDRRASDFSLTLQRSQSPNQRRNYHFGHGTVVGAIEGWEVVPGTGRTTR